MLQFLKNIDNTKCFVYQQAVSPEEYKRRLAENEVNFYIFNIITNFYYIIFEFTNDSYRQRL